MLHHQGLAHILPVEYNSDSIGTQICISINQISLDFICTVALESIQTSLTFLILYWDVDKVLNVQILINHHSVAQYLFLNQNLKSPIFKSILTSHLVLVQSLAVTFSLGKPLQAFHTIFPDRSICPEAPSDLNLEIHKRSEYFCK